MLTWTYIFVALVYLSIIVISSAGPHIHLRLGTCDYDSETTTMSDVWVSCQMGNILHLQKVDSNVIALTGCECYDIEIYLLKAFFCKNQLRVKAVCGCYFWANIEGLSRHGDSLLLKFVNVFHQNKNITKTSITLSTTEITRLTVFQKL